MNHTVNATSEVANSFGDATGLGPVVIIFIYIFGALLAAQFVAPWIARSQLLSKVGGGFVKSMIYVIKGLGTSAVLLIIGLPVYLVGTADGQTKVWAIELLVGTIVAYITFLVIGFLADKAVSKFIDAHPNIDGWDDVFPEGGEME